MPDDGSHLDMNRVTHFRSHFRPKKVHLGHMAEEIRRQEFALSGASRTLLSQHRGPLRLRCNSWAAVTCWVWWTEARLKQKAQSAWFSFQRACGWYNWSWQSEDGMIPHPYPRLLVLTDITQIYSSPQQSFPPLELPGNRAVEQWVY